jgi:hypothetical protein
LQDPPGITDAVVVLQNQPEQPRPISTLLKKRKQPRVMSNPAKTTMRMIGRHNHAHQTKRSVRSNMSTCAAESTSVPCSNRDGKSLAKVANGDDANVALMLSRITGIYRLSAFSARNYASHSVCREYGSVQGTRRQNRSRICTRLIAFPPSRMFYPE